MPIQELRASRTFLQDISALIASRAADRDLDEAGLCRAHGMQTGMRSNPIFHAAAYMRYA